MPAPLALATVCALAEPWRRGGGVAQLRHGEQGTGRLFGSARAKCPLTLCCAQDDGKIEELLEIVRDVVKGWPFDD